MALLDTLRAAARRAGLRNPVARATPTNLQVPPATAADVAYQVEYAVSSGALHAWRLEGLGIDVRGARIMEIGPGVAFGAIAYLRACGAEVAVSDRWLAPWSDPFHGPVYSGIADRMEAEGRFDVAPLRRMVEAKGYVEGTIRCIFEASEHLGSIRDGEFDALISNAVLEHIETPATAFAEFFRVTRPGGAGLHQVDFRDHRDFSQPLEHLLLRPQAFRRMTDKVNSELGSQLRQVDYETLLRAAGFHVHKYESNDRAPDAYLDSLISRLETAGRMKPGWTRDQLGDLGGLFFLRRP
jgi:SAM-dependent methyltransferase